ncbi:MAG: rhamnulokinase [Spartobacteria bacterium]|nr:rhamnulokinase [Spartobacteria bacterium]
MNETKQLIAMDCGNSSYRLVLGTYANGTVEMKVLAQEKNTMVMMNGLYYWDIVKMFQFLLKNLKKCVLQGIKPDAIGICTWGVDFAFFDKEGFGLGDMLSYRNTMGQEVLDRLSKDKQDELFYKTGIVCDRINSAYLMSALKEIMPSRTGAAHHVLMVPDIFNYLLTGKMINEPSELSTTQLMNTRTRAVDTEVCESFGIPPSWFSEIGQHGRAIGELLPSIKEDIGLEGSLPVICVPSHDTASAVAAIPTQENEFLFISSGTWSLIGAEIDEPIITKEVLDARLTNEVGAFGKITLLKNSAGMFILDRMKREYEEEIEAISWDDFFSLSDDTSGNTVIDVNEARFFNPPHMTKCIHEALMEKEPSFPYSYAKIIAVVQHSMANNYAKTLQALEKATQKSFDCVYMVGGGTRNETINQMTADYSGKRVVTCGDESTCLGNLGSQLTYFYPKMTLNNIRDVLSKSIEIKEFRPNI